MAQRGHVSVKNVLVYSDVVIGIALCSEGEGALSLGPHSVARVAAWDAVIYGDLPVCVLFFCRRAVSDLESPQLLHTKAITKVH